LLESDNHAHVKEAVWNSYPPIAWSFEERAKMRACVSGRRGWRRASAVVGAVCALWGTSVAVVETTPAQATVRRRLATFDTPGSFTWTVPTGVTKITLTVYGASGGDVTTVLLGRFPEIVSVGGAGGESKGTFKVKPGETFLIEIGGQGGSVNESTTSTGGSGGVNNLTGMGQSTTPPGAGGGGASDVRMGGKGNSCATDHASCRFQDRIIVAGGGGGGGGGWSPSNCTPLDGGDGGGYAGANAPGGCANGGQQNGEPGQPPSSLQFVGWFGSGGTGAPSGSLQTTGGGGGGSGWFGGDGNTGGAGGAGGSGYISPLALGGSFPGGTRTGDGLVIIATP
jgi:hypothetical protein